jgi:hypothetical protein
VSAGLLDSSVIFGSGANKEVFVDALVHARKSIIDNKPNYADSVKAELDSKVDACQGFAYVERKKLELKRPFYNPPEAARAHFLKRKYHIEYPENEHDPEQQFLGVEDLDYRQTPVPHGRIARGTL